MTARHGHAHHDAHAESHKAHSHEAHAHEAHTREAHTHEANTHGEPGAHHHHDHGGCAHADARRTQAPLAMAEAEALCRERGVRLTELRRSVLAALYETHRPLGAYDLADILAGQSGKRIAPVTVYRVLEFLTEQGFVHRLVTRNAFIACPHQHDAGDVTVFLICARCGGVDEMESPAINTAIGDLLKSSHFTPAAKIVEIDGVCAHCNEAGGAVAPTSA